MAPHVETAQWLKELVAALAEDLEFILSTYTASLNHLEFQFQWSRCLLLATIGTIHACCAEA